MRWHHETDGLYFERHEDGSVHIVKTDGPRPEEGGRISFQTRIDEGAWVSAVLAMSAFSQRPNDWYRWLKHHRGEVDLLSD